MRLTRTLPYHLQSGITRLPWLSLGLYSLSLGLVGWSLSLFSVITYGVMFLLVLTLYYLSRSQIWFHGLFGHAPQILLITLIGSICVTALFVVSNLSLLIIVPALSTFLAWQELLYRDYPRRHIFFILVIMAAVGLGLGEVIDLFLIPFSSLNFHVHRFGVEGAE